MSAKQVRKRSCGMGNHSGIWADNVQCGQCLYQGRPVSGITGRKQLSIAESWRNDHGDGEAGKKKMAGMKVLRISMLAVF